MKKIVILVMAALGGVTQAEPEKRLPEDLSLGRAISSQDRGEVQVTASVQYFKMPEEKTLATAAEIEYGITDRLEVDAEVPYLLTNPGGDDPVRGPGDVELALRYAFVPVTERPFAFNAGMNVAMPTGSRSKELGEGRVALGPFFTASRWLGPVNLQCDAGWNRSVSDQDDEPRNEVEYNVAAIYPVRNFFLVLEGNCESNRDCTQYYITPELIWQSQRGCAVNVALPLGVTRDAADFGVAVSASVEFEWPFARGDGD